MREGIAADSLEAIGDRLRVLRAALGYETQAAFANLVGIEPSAWSNYEVGEKRISIDQAMKITRRTPISLDWIYRGLENGLHPDLVMRLRDADEPHPQASPPTKRRGRPRRARGDVAGPVASRR